MPSGSAENTEGVIVAEGTSGEAACTLPFHSNVRELLLLLCSVLRAVCRS